MVAVDLAVMMAVILGQYRFTYANTAVLLCIELAEVIYLKFWTMKFAIIL